MKIERILFVISFVLLGFQSEAGHDIGYELSYRHVQNYQYQVIVTRYSDCRLLIAPSPVEVSCSGISRILSDLDSTVVKELDVFCPSILTQCNGGVAEGFRKTVFYYPLDLNDTTYSGLRSCSTLSVQTRIANLISTNTGAVTHLADMIIDLDTNKRNSSPTFTLDPNPILCCNKPAYLKLGATDSEGDSLSFVWGRVKNNLGNFITYNNSKSYNNPINTYYPSNLTFPFNSPTANPPIGIYLDPHTGELIFTPTTCTESTIISIQVNEWRKDTNGVFQLIGSTSRIIKYFVSTCSGNVDPTISGPIDASVCIGDSIRLFYETDDRPSYPQQSIPPIQDSVSLSWNSQIQGASFEILSDTVLSQSGVFSWRPDSTVVTNKTYTFVLTAKDNNCPITGIANQRVNITVRDKVIASLKKQNIGCGTVDYTLQSDIACLKGSPIYSFAITDTNGTPVSSLEANLTLRRNANNARLKVAKPGIYVVVATLSNDSLTYTRTFKDTLDYTDLLTFALAPDDTTLCIGDTLSIAPVSLNALGNITYNWSSSQLQSISTASSLDVFLTQPNKSDTFTLTIKDKNNCQVSDTIVVANQYLAAPKLKNDTFCSTEKPLVSIGGEYSNFLWNGSSGDSTFQIDSSMMLQVSYTDVNSCVYLDTAFFRALPTPRLNLIDTVHCGTNYTLEIGSYPTVHWSTGHTLSSFYITQSGQYSVSVQNEFGCEANDTATVILLDFDTRILPRDTSGCASTISLYPGIYDSYRWNTGDSTATIRAQAEGKYYVEVGGVNGCFRTDTIDVILLSNTKVPLLTKLSDRIQSSEQGLHKWFKNNTIQVGKTDNFLITQSKGTYTALSIDTNGCESDTSEPYRITLSNTPLSLQKLKIYPNPTNGKVTIDATGIGKIQRITLYNTNGKLVENTQAVNGSLIDLSWEARSGIYWVVVTTDKGIFRSEVVSVK